MDYNIHMNKNNHGFTLIELIVTMAVVAIVLVAGIPALSNMSGSNRLVTQINSLAGSLALARSEAIKSAITVTVCASSNTTSCNVNTWQSGWIVFTDRDKDAVIDVGTDRKIQVQGALNGNPELRLTLTAVPGRFQFSPDGSSRTNIRASFILCPQDKVVTLAKAVNINFIGRSSLAKGITPTAKPVLDAAGNPVTCP